MQKDDLILDRYIKQVRADTLIIWGDRDRFKDVSGAYYLAENIAHNELRILPDAGACVISTLPGENRAAIHRVSWARLRRGEIEFGGSALRRSKAARRRAGSERRGKGSGGSFVRSFGNPEEPAEVGLIDTQFPNRTPCGFRVWHAASPPQDVDSLVTGAPEHSARSRPGAGNGPTQSAAAGKFDDQCPEPIRFFVVH